MIDLRQAITGLWEIFRDDVASGDQVYFCFSRDELAERFLPLGTKADTVVQEISELANTFYEIDGDDVSIKRIAFSPVVDGFSSVIVLVCQQVLAVEEMTRDPSGFSENAYFPRLWAMIDPSLRKRSANPFAFDEFVLVWRTLAREIRSIPGSSDELTFEFGVHEGFNKARSFPLSQALLSREDLDVLLRRARVDKLRLGAPRDVWTEIRRERHHLGRRGQRLIDGAFLQNRIIEQVQKYSRRTPTPTTDSAPVRQASNVEQLELRVHKELVDWSEEFRPYLHSMRKHEDVFDDSLVESKVAGIIAQHGYVFLTQGLLGDYWKLGTETTEVAPGDSVLLLSSESALSRARSDARLLAPPIDLNTSQIGALDSKGKVRVGIVELPPSHPRTVVISGGRLMLAGSARSGQSYRWLGGICLDARSQKYLREALPHRIHFDDTEYGIDELDRVVGHALSYASLPRWLDRLESDASLEVVFPNGKVARLGIAVARDAEPESMGYRIDQSGKLSPTAELMISADSFLVGFREPAPTDRGLSLRDLVPVIMDLRQRAGRALTPTEVTDIRRVVQQSTMPTATKRALDRLLQVGGRLRDGTIAHIYAVIGAGRGRSIA